MEANRASVVEGVGRAASAWVADECGRVPGQALSPEEEKQHADLVQAAKIKELDTWKKFDVSETRKGRRVVKQVAQTR